MDQRKRKTWDKNCDGVTHRFRCFPYDLFSESLPRRDTSDRLLQELSFCKKKSTCFLSMTWLATFIHLYPLWFFVEARMASSSKPLCGF